MQTCCAKANRSGDALAHQGRELRFADFVCRQQADRDLRRAAVERRTQAAPTLIAYMHQRSRRSLGGRHQIGAIDPEVSAAQARRAAMVHGYDGNGIGQSVLARNRMLILRGMVNLPLRINPPPVVAVCEPWCPTAKSRNLVASEIAISPGWPRSHWAVYGSRQPRLPTLAFPGPHE